jgi:carbonic anhydrase/acetyltransferase-like protein (isoleucine patch superfamily)
MKTKMQNNMQLNFNVLFLRLLLPSFITLLWAQSTMAMYWCLRQKIPCGFSSKFVAMKKGTCTYNKDGSYGGYVANSAFISQVRDKDEFFKIINEGHLDINAEVCDQARVTGSYTIKGPVKILHQARVSGDVYLEGKITIQNQAQVTDHAIIRGPVTVGNWASVKQFASVRSKNPSFIGGQVQVTGQTIINADFNLTDNFVFAGESLVLGPQIDSSLFRTQSDSLMYTLASLKAATDPNPRCYISLLPYVNIPIDILRQKFKYAFTDYDQYLINCNHCSDGKYDFEDWFKKGHKIDERLCNQCKTFGPEL